MKKGIFFSFIAFVILIASCECEDCGPIVFNPTFEAQFVNTDSVDQLELILEDLNAEQDILEDTIDWFVDFIATLEDPDSITNYTIAQADYTALKTIVDDQITSVRNNMDSVSQGYLIITEIINRDNGESYQPDTTNLYDIPLPLAAGTNNASFEFVILGESYFLDVSFEAQESLDVLGEIDLEISNFAINESTMSFDSLITLDGPVYQFEF